MDNGSSLDREGRDVELVVNVVSARAEHIPAGSVLATIPAGFRPSKELDFACAVFTAQDYPMAGWVAVMPDGTVKVKDYISGGNMAAQFKAVCRYFVA